MVLPMHTMEPQYDEIITHYQEHGSTELGMMLSHTWHEDPKRLGFVLARYKFVSKILAGKNHVLEVGCSSGFPSHIVRQTVNNLTAIDFDPIFIDEAKKNFNSKWPISFFVHDIIEGSLLNTEAPSWGWDAIYSLDVLEHISPNQEYEFMFNIHRSLDKDGVCIIGSPTIHSLPFASSQSKAAHVNCKTQDQLKELMQKFYKNITMVSMNDEVIHFGHSGMSHYQFALGYGKNDFNMGNT